MNVSCRRFVFALLVAASVGGTFACKNGTPAPTAAADSQAAVAAPPQATGPVMGKLDEANFSLSLQTSGTYKAGQQGEIQVVLEPKGTFHCNQEYPYKMKLGTPPAGVSYPSAVVRSDAMTIKPEKSVMKVPFVVDKPGEVQLSGNFFFSICTSEQCVIDNREMAVMVKVE